MASTRSSFSGASSEPCRNSTGDLSTFASNLAFAAAIWSASATVFAAAQNLRTPSTAATTSRASRSGPSSPSDASSAEHPASRSPIVPIGNVVATKDAPPLLTQLLLYGGDFEGFNERIDF